MAISKFQRSRLTIDLLAKAAHIGVPSKILKQISQKPLGQLTSNFIMKVNKCAKIRSRYNQVQHPIQDTNGKVTNSQLDTTDESQEVSPFPAGDHKAHINRRGQRHSKYKTEQKHKRSTKKSEPS